MCLSCNARNKKEKIKGKNNQRKDKQINKKNQPGTKNFGKQKLWKYLLTIYYQKKKITKKTSTKYCKKVCNNTSNETITINIKT